MITNLRSIRRMRGMTQEQLAMASGIHKITICRYEKGLVDPTLTSAEKLSKALGVTIDDLRGNDHDELPDDQ